MNSHIGYKNLSQFGACARFAKTSQVPIWLTLNKSPSLLQFFSCCIYFIYFFALRGNIKMNSIYSVYQNYSSYRSFWFSLMLHYWAGWTEFQWLENRNIDQKLVRNSCWLSIYLFQFNDKGTWPTPKDIVLVHHCWFKIGIVH